MKPLTLILRPGPISNDRLLKRARLGALRDATEDSRDCNKLIPSLLEELAALISDVNGAGASGSEGVAEYTMSL